MPIAEIIHEIDAYLLRLRQARELLSGRFTEVPQKKQPLRGKKTQVRRTDTTLSTKRQAAGNKLRSNRPIAHRKGEKSLGEPAVQVSSAVPPPQTANTEQSAIVQPERTIPHTVTITRLPASRRTSSVRSGPHRGAKSASHTCPEPTKPAISL